MFIVEEGVLYATDSCSEGTMTLMAFLSTSEDATTMSALTVSGLLFVSWGTHALHVKDSVFLICLPRSS